MLPFNAKSFSPCRTCASGCVSASATSNELNILAGSIMRLSCEVLNKNVRGRRRLIVPPVRTRPIVSAAPGMVRNLSFGALGNLAASASGRALYSCFTSVDNAGGGRCAKVLGSCGLVCVYTRSFSDCTVSPIVAPALCGVDGNNVILGGCCGTFGGAAAGNRCTLVANL